jgi:hypothetical protein
MDIDALAALAGNTVVAAAVTDSFEGVRRTVARIFGRDKADPGTERRLDTTRQRLTAASQDDADDARTAQAGQWATRFADLLAEHPEAIAEVRALIADLQAALPGGGDNVTNTISGSVKHGPVLMGRDFGDVTIGSPPYPEPPHASPASD